MSGPAGTGTDGEVNDDDGRTWRWSSAHEAWLPADPEPFESVRSQTGTTWMFVRQAGGWLDVLDFPSPTETGALGGTFDTVVRDADGL
jgi:hypothetical protein